MRRLIQFELRKIFLRRLTQFFLIALFLVSVLFMFSTYQNKYAFDGASREGSGREAVEIDKSIAEKYGGTLTDEKVRHMLADKRKISLSECHAVCRVCPVFRYSWQLEWTDGFRCVR